LPFWEAFTISSRAIKSSSNGPKIRTQQIMVIETIACPSCGAMNRVPLEKLNEGLQPVCGRCKSPLLDSGTPITVTDDTFAAEVEHSPLPVLVDMWAPWCGPCRMVAPTVEQIARETEGKLRVAKMNVDENPVTAERFKIQSIPALLFFRGGVEVDRIVGALPKATLAARLAPFLR